MDSSVLSVLTRPGNVVFSSNIPFLKDLAAAGGRMARQRSGHLVFYGPNNRRILATDPDGNPLHECEWGTAASGQTLLIRARIRLEWGQWVGIKPAGLINTTTLDLSKKPGWERLKADDLRQMAAQSMHVPLEAVKLFYGDEDLIIDSKGTALIRHKRDAFYVLDNGTFAHARFMACMGAMHWANIDFMPVVELFQSLLPGTGSAAFELIRGLYDDQNEGHPAPLRYRGIPTYPSEAAYRLFSSFFTPQAPGGSNPLPVFTDVARSHEVTWLPAANPPLRFFDPAHNLCVTVKGKAVHKATRLDDPTGLPFLSPGPGNNPLERIVAVAKGMIVLQDRDTKVELPVNPAWGPLQDSLDEKRPLAPAGWTSLFGNQPPQITPQEAFSAVLLYPDDDAEISEVASQPFVADYIQDGFEQDPRLAAHLAKSTRILIDNFDGAIKTCITLDRPRNYTALYTRPPYAQKQAQNIWSELARSQRFDLAKSILLVPATSRVDAYRNSHDLLFLWIPFSIFTDAIAQHEVIKTVPAALEQGGLAFIVGPDTAKSAIQMQLQLQIIHMEPVESLPAFRMHQAILPKARLKQGLTLFHVGKG